MSQATRLMKRICPLRINFNQTTDKFINTVKIKTLIMAALLCPLSLFAQTTYPLGAYTQPLNPTIDNQSDWQKLGSGVQASWASRDIHYGQRAVPSLNIKTDTTIYAWKGERVGALAVLFSATQTAGLSLSLSGVPEGWTAKANFVNYVISDGKRNCGNNPKNTPLTYIPDVIDINETKSLHAMETSPVWITLEVPQTAAAGEYTLALTVKEGTTDVETLHLNVVVKDRQLPLPSQYAFQTNFWQQPYSVARYYGVKKWSQAHFDALRPYLELLARCGQKSVTAILFYEPWGAQSIDKHDEMIRSVKKDDGTWEYDYSVFDHYVSLCDSCGINEQISCFSMVPWDMNFRYYNERGDTLETGSISINSTEYKEVWTNFLKAFAQHLRDKGWFSKTYIAMDERALNVMQSAYNLLQQTVPGMKMSLAGNYHSELAGKLQDYCVAWGQRFTASELRARQDSNWITTYYTACPDLAPNMETYNDPADIAYLPLHAVANSFTGFLHWSWMHWVDQPLLDSRGDLFPPGDYYSIYPGPRSSVRYERYIEGVQQAEKIRILRSLWANDQVRLDSLEQQLAKFQSGKITQPNTSARLVNVIEAILNESPVPPLEPADSYCTPTMTYSNNQKKATVLANRWVDSVSVSGEGVDEPVTLKWTNGPDNGYAQAPQTLVLRPGKRVTFFLHGFRGTDDIRFCRAAFFADWDYDRNFGSRDDEYVATAGVAGSRAIQTTGNTDVLDFTVSFVVPADAKENTLLRLRATYADAWSAEPTDCGTLSNGYCLDFFAIVSTDSIQPEKIYCTPTLNATNKDVAIQKRWLTTATVSGDAVEKTVEMSWSAPSTEGYVLADAPVTLSPDKKVTLRLKGTENDDDLRFCRVILFADWDGDGNFGSRNDERIDTTGAVGSNAIARTGNPGVLDYNVTFTVPADALMNTRLRLRAVYNDAWAALPSACGELNKGFCFDLPIIVSDDEVGIPSVRNTGEIQWLPSGLQTSQKVNVAVYNLNGIPVDYAKAVHSYSFAHFTPGTYVITVSDSFGRVAEKKIIK